MELLVDILEEVLEDVFSLLVESPKIPKPIRYGLVAALAGFVAAIGILVGIQGETLAGKIFGYALSALSIAAGIYLARKVYKS